MEIDECDLYTAGAEAHVSRASLVDMTHLNIASDWPEEDIYTAYESGPKPSAPLDVAKLKVKVDWRGAFPERWGAKLQKALQSWLSKVEGKPSVLSLKLTDDDPSCAEVQITPSAALNVSNIRTAELKFKDEGEVVTAWIYQNKAQFLAGAEKTLKEEKRAPSPKVNTPEQVKTAEVTPEPSAPFLLPLHLSWYLYNAYGKEMKEIGEKHGVNICAQVSISIQPKEDGRSDSVSKASDDFGKLVQGCVDGFSHATIDHNDMDSDIVKEGIRSIKTGQTKMMFTLTDRNGLFSGPKKFTDTIKEKTRAEKHFKDKPSLMDLVHRTPPQQKPSLTMNTKDLENKLEMEKVHWDLMKLSHEEQLSQLETKYGVMFNEEKSQNNSTIKVQARSKPDQHINLEGHAVRALTQLYQKLASSAMTCELTKASDQPCVMTEVDKLKQEKHCVIVYDDWKVWRLVGLPEHLGPAIYHIEKTLQKKPFNQEMKKLMGYSEDIPRARGIKRSQIPDLGLGAEGGLSHFRRRSERNTGLNKGISRDDGKGAKEETCSICMDSFTDKSKLKCGHEFCGECIKRSVKSLGSICPVCDVSDQEKKKLMGYSEDIPHARGIKRNQIPDLGLGAVGGPERDEGVDFRRPCETDTGLGEESKGIKWNQKSPDG